MLYKVNEYKHTDLHVHQAQLPRGQDPQEGKSEHGDEAGNRDGDDFSHPKHRHYQDHECAPALLKKRSDGKLTLEITIFIKGTLGVEREVPFLFIFMQLCIEELL